MDETLRSNQAWLQEIFQSFNDVAWSAEPSTWRTLFLSQSAEVVYGRPVSEFFDNPDLWRSLIHPDDRDRVERLLPVLFSTGMLDLEYQIVRPNGNERLLYHRLRLIRDVKGEAKRIDGLATDITDLTSKVKTHKSQGWRQGAGKDYSSPTKLDNSAPSEQNDQVQGWIETPDLSCEEKEKFQKFQAPECTREVNSKSKIQNPKSNDSALNQLRTIFNESLDAMLIADDEGNYIDANPAACKLFGLPKSELLKCNVSNFTEPGFDLTQSWHSFLEQGRAKGEFRLVRPDGTVRDTEFAAMANVVSHCHLSVLRDITERKQAEVALRSSERQYRSLVETSQDIIWSVDLEGCLTFVNSAVKQIYGYDPSEMIGRPFTDFVPPVQVAKNWEGFERLLQGESLFQYEMTHVAKDGRLIYLLCNAIALLDEQGQAVGVTGTASDITEWKQAEKKLRHSEERYRNLVETTSDWVWEMDEDLVYTYVSPKVRDLLGYDPQPIKGLTPCDLMPLREHQRMVNFFCQLLVVKEPFSRLENTQIHKDGHLVVMEMSGVPVFDSDRKFCGYHGISRDITDRKRMEEALRESQQKYQTLFESLPIGIAITNAAGTIVEANPASERILGISTAEHTNRQHDSPEWQFLRPDGTAMPRSEWASVRALTENRAIENVEAGLLKPNGTVTWLSITAAPIPIPGYSLAIAYTDISDAYSELRLRKQAEETLKLQAERERLMRAMQGRIRQSLNLDKILNTTVEEVRQLLQNDRVLLFQLCDDGVGRVVTESVAPGLPMMAGMEFPDEVFPEDCYLYYCHGLPRIVPDIAHDQFAPCLTEFLQQLGVKSKLVIPIVRSNQQGISTSDSSVFSQTMLWGVIVAHDCSGTRQWQQWEIDLLSSLATQIGIAIQQSELYLLLKAQLTELQQTEIALQQAKEAAISEAARSAVANRAKSEFLANMSHELRTPLNGILGYAQILKKDTNLTEHQQNSLSIIHQCGEHLLTLIEDILDLSKIEAQKMELSPTEFHLPNFLKSLTDVFWMRAQQKDIAFSYEILSPLPNGVMADKKRLRQVLFNLLSNAVKFTDKGGVTFKVGYVGNGEWGQGGQGGCFVQNAGEQSADSTSHPLIPTSSQSSQLPIPKIRFQIEDTGIGIEPSQIEKIFLPFHQVSDRAHAVEGTGLGLAISQKLVQMMGSDIKVTSTLGQGSVFWFDLELPPVSGWDELNPSSDRPIIGYKGHKRQVLVVDDHQVNRSLFRELLEVVGFEVLEAVNGQEGLHKAVESHPDVILMDLLMPVLDGLETTRRLRQLPQLNPVVVIALSANVFEATRQESLAVGCQDFLPKPVQADRLLDAIARHLGLEWIYEEHRYNLGVEPNLDKVPLIPPPLDEIAALSELIKIGDVANILERAKYLEVLDDRLVPFASRIYKLAKAFKLKQLREMLQHYLADSQ